MIWPKQIDVPMSNNSSLHRIDIGLRLHFPDQLSFDNSE